MKRIYNILLSMFAVLALASCGKSGPAPECKWPIDNLYFRDVKLTPPSNKPYTYDGYLSFLPLTTFRSALEPLLKDSKIVFTTESIGCTGSITSKQKTYSIAERDKCQLTTLKELPMPRGLKNNTLEYIDNNTTIMVVAGPLLASNGKYGYVFWQKRYEGRSIYDPEFVVTGIYKQDVNISEIYKNGSFN